MRKNSKTNIQMTKKLNLCIFISGQGSNLKAILDACKNPNFPARVSCIITNKETAGGIDHAKSYNIPYAVISHKDYATKEAFEQAILDALKYEPVDLICLAGFMRILSPYFLEQWGRDIISIHPSLLPKHKGLDTHKRAIAAGDKHAGCTVHYVIPEIDAGNTIVQKTVTISPKDTEDSLAKKVLAQEHLAYPEAIRLVAEGKISHTMLKTIKDTPIQNGDKHMANKASTQESKAMWEGFTLAIKYGTISVTIVLGLMALFLL
jgi:phosphoribosylglycinamide formyltransferase-1